jgi:hypothetical protein
VVIDGSKFKAVNNRDRNYTPGKLKRKREELERRIDRYRYGINLLREMRSRLDGPYYGNGFRIIISDMAA